MRERIVVYVIISIILLLFILRMVVLDMTISWGFVYDDLLDQISSQKKANLLVKDEILSNESLSLIEAKATAMGFIKGEPLIL